MTLENGWGWNLHVDNSDMSSIASCDVEFIEQIQAIMEIYKDYRKRRIYGDFYYGQNYFACAYQLASDLYDNSDDAYRCT